MRLFDYFSKICLANLSFIKIWQEWLIICKNSNIYLWSYLVLLRMRNVSEKSRKDNRNAYFTLNYFFFENCIFYVIMWNNTVDVMEPIGSSVPVQAHYFLLALPLPRSNPTRYKYPTQSCHWHTSFTCLWRWNRQWVPKLRQLELRRRGITQKGTNYI